MFFALSINLIFHPFLRKKRDWCHDYFRRSVLITCYLKNVVVSCVFILQHETSWIDIFHGKGLTHAALTHSHLLLPSLHHLIYLLVVLKGCLLRSTNDHHFARTCCVDGTCVHYSSVGNMGGVAIL